MGTTVKPKRVIISSLAMRFYANDGWSRELLEDYIPEQGRRQEKLAQKGNKNVPFDSVYWILDMGWKLDVERLVADGHVGELVGKEDYSELKFLDDLQILKNRNG